MTLPQRFLWSALLIALPSCSAAAATVPANLVGEWFQGAQYPANVYTADYGGANSDSSRLLLNKDGSYVFTQFESTYYPASFGFSGYPITCQMMDVTVERGTFSLQASKITFKPKGVNQVLAMSPDRLNNGCKRFSGSKKTRESEADSGTWQVGSGQLTLKFGNAAEKYVRRTPAAPSAPAATGLDSSLRGEWHSGRISPIEYYNTATGKWAEASGTSIILKLQANFTYERTGLMVVTTYGCTSKLLVQEKGKVTQSGATLTFTPTTSSATGYTCSPSKVSTSKNHIKPYTERATVKVDLRGQHTLVLTSGSGDTLFNRPLGTPPESAPSSAQGTLTPPVPREGGSSTTPSRSTPNSSSGAPTAPAAPTRWTATGKWDAVITVNGKTYPVQIELQDDSPRILGFGNDPVEYANGNSETGTLDIGLEVDGQTMQLKVQGRFDGDRYQGQVRWTNYEGDDLGRGTLSMTRR